MFRLYEWESLFRIKVNVRGEVGVFDLVVEDVRLGCVGLKFFLVFR